MCFSITFITTQGIITLAEEASISPIKVVYLKQYEDTPFAVRVEKYIRLEADGSSLTPSAVATKIGNNALGCLASSVVSYRYFKDYDCYLADYAETVYLNAKTTDGNQDSYYLDLNNSFYSFYVKFLSSTERAEVNLSFFGLNSGDNLAYQGLEYGGDYDCLNSGKDVLDGFVDSDFFEYCLNRVRQEYPSVAGLNPNELFGYWGFIVIPSSNSLTDLVSNNLLSVDTTYSGLVDYFTISDITLTKKQYNALLEEYGYSYLSILWAKFVNLFGSSQNASACFCYASGQYNEAFIAKNGAESIDDNRGAIVVKTDQALESVGNKIEDWLNNVFNDSDVKKILASILGLVGALIILTLFFKIFGLFRKARKQVEKNNKKKEKKKQKKQKRQSNKLNELKDSLTSRIHKDI